MALSETLRFRAKSFGKYRTITAAESALRPFDFPMGTQFVWQLLGEGSERAFLYILLETLGAFIGCLLDSASYMLRYGAWWYLVSSSFWPPGQSFRLLE